MPLKIAQDQEGPRRADDLQRLGQGAGPAVKLCPSHPSRKSKLLKKTQHVSLSTMLSREGTGLVDEQEAALSRRLGGQVAWACVSLPCAPLAGAAGVPAVWRVLGLMLGPCAGGLRCR
jgi:hypothetical protein